MVKELRLRGDDTDYLSTVARRRKDRKAFIQARGVELWVEEMKIRGGMESGDEGSREDDENEEEKEGEWGSDEHIVRGNGDGSGRESGSEEPDGDNDLDIDNGSGRESESEEQDIDNGSGRGSQEKDFPPDQERRNSEVSISPKLAERDRKTPSNSQGGPKCTRPGLSGMGWGDAACEWLAGLEAAHIRRCLADDCRVAVDRTNPPHRRYVRERTCTHVAHYPLPACAAVEVVGLGGDESPCYKTASSRSRDDAEVVGLGGEESLVYKAASSRSRDAAKASPFPNVFHPERALNHSGSPSAGT